MTKLKIGDFVKHKKAEGIIFQIAEILTPVHDKDHRMMVCHNVSGARFYSYIEGDLSECEFRTFEEKETTEEEYPLKVAGIIYEIIKKLKSESEDVHEAIAMWSMIGLSLFVETDEENKKNNDVIVDKMIQYLEEWQHILKASD